MNTIQPLKFDNFKCIIQELDSKSIALQEDISDFTKVKRRLTEEAARVTSGYDEVCGNAVKLCETSKITNYKIDCSIKKLREAQQINSWCSEKILDYNCKSDEERKELISSISKWAEKVGVLTEELKLAATLYNKDISSEIQLSKTKEDLLQHKIAEFEKELALNKKEKIKLEAVEDDQFTARHFLQSDASLTIINTPEDFFQCGLNREKLLCSKKEGLQKWIAENKQFS